MNDENIKIMKNVSIESGFKFLTIQPKSKYCAIPVSALSGNETKLKKMVLDLISEARTDYGINFFVRVPDDCDVWIYYMDLDHYFNGHLVWGLPEEISEGDRDNIQALMLDESDLHHLLKFGEAYITSFCMAGELVGDDIIVKRPKEMYKYYVFDKKKSRRHFKSDDKKLNFKFLKADLTSLMIVIDVNEVRDFKNLSKKYPVLFKLEEDIQEKLKSLPEANEYISNRLDLLRRLYIENWESAWPWVSKEIKEVEAIHNLVVQELVKYYLNEDIKYGVRLGRDFAKFSASLILPDCFFLDKGMRPKISNAVLQSNYVPKKLWLMHCFSRYFLRFTRMKNIDKKDFHERREQFVNMLTAFNNPKAENALSEHDRTTMYTLLNAFPELVYFRDLTFTVAEARDIARICMPSSLL